MEVTGCPDEAKWACGQAFEPDEWTSHAPLTRNKIRSVHEVTLGPVWVDDFIASRYQRQRRRSSADESGHLVC